MLFYYIHGYGSTGQRSFQGLKEAGLKDLILVSWNSDKSYQETLKQIKSQIELDEELCLIASSFGGYWTSQLHFKNIAHIFLINPLIDPYISYKEGHFKKEFSEEIAATYLNHNNRLITNPQRLQIYLATDDEVLDYKIAEAAYKDISQIDYINGGHKLSNFKQVAEEVLRDQFQVTE